MDKEDIFSISAVTGENVRQVLFQSVKRLAETPEIEILDEVPVYRLETDPKQFQILREDGGWRVHGEAIERAAAMTYWEFDASIRRFQKILKAIGVEDALRNSGVKEGDIVYIGEYELEWSD